MKSYQETLELHTLILRTAEKDEASFKALYDEMAEPVSRFLLYKFGRKLCPEDIEDITQYTFAQVWQKAGTYRGRHTNSSAKKWILTIAYNEGLKILKIMQQIQFSIDAHPTHVDDSEGNMSVLEYKFPSHKNTEEDALTTVLIQKIFRICRNLPEREQEIFIKRFDRECTYKEIGKDYGLSTPRIKQIIDHILKTIYRAL